MEECLRFREFTGVSWDQIMITSLKELRREDGIIPGFVIATKNVEESDWSLFLDVTEPWACDLCHQHDYVCHWDFTISQK